MHSPVSLESIRFSTEEILNGPPSQFEMLLPSGGINAAEIFGTEMRGISSHNLETQAHHLAMLYSHSTDAFRSATLFW